MKPRIVLVGLPGAGKTTVGRRLARALNCEFVDTDELIEARFPGQHCGEIFAELGEPEFRRIEHEVVAEALTGGGVLALGGGAVTTAATRDLLADHTVVYLDVSPREGLGRAQADHANPRPVLDADDPLRHYEALAEARRPYYEAVATVKVRTENLTPAKIVTTILGNVEAAAHGAHTVPMENERISEEFL